MKLCKVIPTGLYWRAGLGRCLRQLDGQQLQERPRRFCGRGRRARRGRGGGRRRGGTWGRCSGSRSSRCTRGGRSATSARACTCACATRYLGLSTMETTMSMI